MNQVEGFPAVAIRRAINRNALRALFLACLVLSAAPRARAESEAPETYKWRLDGFGWFSLPGGHFSDTENAPPSHSFDIQKDFGFGSYLTFTGNVDWRFTRRNHLLFGASPVQSSNTRTLTRTITFRGQTYDLGSAVSVDIQSLSFSPGYQFDFMRRRWGNLSGVAQLFVLNTNAKMSQSRTVNGQSKVIEESSGSVLAPLPAIGPRVRWYPVNDSSRFVVDGIATGMYLFGYGDFYSAKGTFGVAVSRHWKLTGGYQMGTRLTIHGTEDSMGFRLTQKGPMAGFEGVW